MEVQAAGAACAKDLGPGGRVLQPRHRKDRSWKLDSDWEGGVERTSPHAGQAKDAGLVLKDYKQEKVG